jgi:hypothetical protein
MREATDEKNIPVASQFETFTGKFQKACNGNIPDKKTGDATWSVSRGWKR